MNRPYIFCHMMTSIDGKIMGDYMETPEGDSRQCILRHSIWKVALLSSSGMVVRTYHNRRQFYFL